MNFVKGYIDTIKYLISGINSIDAGRFMAYISLPCLVIAVLLFLANRDIKKMGKK